MKRAALACTRPDVVNQIHAELKNTFRSGKTKDIAFRKQQLAQLAWMIKDNQERFSDAMKADLGRPPLESDL